MSLSEIQTIAENMIYEDADRDVAFEFYERMYHNLWDMPESLKSIPWVAKIIDSSPYDAINTGVRLLAALPFSTHYQPLSPGTAGRKRANMIERVLDWQMKSADRRRSKAIASDIVLSALLYDAVAVEVIDLPYAIQQKQAVNANAKREKAALAYGRFMVNTHPPRSIHVRASGLMTEALVCIKTRHAQEVIDEWGSQATSIEGLVDLANKPRGTDWITVFDYWDIDRRAVWCAEGRMGNIPEATHTESMVILPESKLATNFIPWVANMGGSTLESDPVHRYKPILYPLYTTGLWEVLNLVESLLVSEVIAHAGSPRFAEQGPNSQEAETDYGDPARKSKVPPGNELIQLAPPGIDAAMTQIDALLASKIDKTTVSRILQGGEVPSGIAFATLNLATQTAVGVLKNAKDLSEKSIAETETKMLLWTKHTGEPLLGYSTEKETKGEQMIVRSKEIATDAIYIEATLHPDDVLDRQQRIAAAALAVKELGVSQEEGLESCGFTDPQNTMKARRKEVILDHYLQLQMLEDRMRLEAKVNMEIQAAQMQMQEAMQIKMAQLQAQLQQQGQQQGAQMPGMDMSTLPMPKGISAGQGYQQQPAGIAMTPEGSVRGEAVNPNAGGLPPAQFNPEQTRESMAGQDILGNSTEIF